MSTISIHDLDPEVERTVRALARASGQSLNRTIKRLLAEQVAGGKKTGHRQRFAAYAGRMDDADYRALREAVQDMESVDPGDWS
ncbi:MAG: hypothetical protein ACOCX4_03005 [Planctomycetota bacterium]